MSSGFPRISKLAALLGDFEVGAFLAWSPVTMGYLHGFHEHAGERLMLLAIRPNGDVRFIGPALSESQARRSGMKDVHVWDDSSDPMSLVRSLVKDWSLENTRLAVDDEMPAQLLLRLQAGIPDAKFECAQPILGTLMRNKEPEELELLLKSAEIADQVWDEVAAKLRPGITERAIAKWLTSGMTDRGAEPYFAIVAAGANGAEPHHLSDSTPLQRGDVVILDFGCDLNGYKSDITRTVAIQTASSKAHEVYSVVHQAHMAARATIVPGATGADIDKAARDVVEAAGYGPKFFHRTGHGIGLRGHEDPYIVSSNQQIILPGDCFSVEPGIYLEGEFGVRIENIVTATPSGYRSLNAEPTVEIMVVS